MKVPHFYAILLFFTENNVFLTGPQDIFFQNTMLCFSVISGSIVTLKLYFLIIKDSYPASPSKLSLSSWFLNSHSVNCLVCLHC